MILDFNPEAPKKFLSLKISIKTKRSILKSVNNWKDLKLFKNAK